jgi:hypothetical protein
MSANGTKRTYRSISTFVRFQLKADRTSGRSASVFAPRPGVINAGHWCEPNGTCGGSVGVILSLASSSIMACRSIAMPLFFLIVPTTYSSAPPEGYKYVRGLL